MKFTLGFIGVGNMGSALVLAAVKKIGSTAIAVCDKDDEKTERLAKEYGVSVLSADKIAENCDYIILGVKPYAVESVIAEIKPFLRKNEEAVLVSMAAGVSLGQISRYLEEERSLIRIMPNTPCTVGQGVIQYAVQALAKEKEEAFVLAFSEAGLLDPIDENLIDAASALSGCGPAFVYLFAEALADGAVECGLPRNKAILYAAKTLQGAGKMIEKYHHIGDLKDSVCSPGGTTIAGVHALEKGGLRGAAMDAVLMAYKRTLSLSK